MRLVVVRTGELHRVRSHYGQAHARGQLHRRYNMGFIISASCALQLEVKTMRKQAAQPQSGIKCARLIALHQCLPDRPGLRTRQGNQALVQFLEPG